MDLGHQRTDLILDNLEKDLVRVYAKSFRETKKELEKVNFILDKYKEDMTQKERIKLWKDKDRLEKLITTLTIDIADANITATKIMNNELINVFNLNYSYGAYQVETLSGYEVYANLYNRNAIKKLLADNINPFTMIALDELKDKKIIQAMLKREFMAAIINGDSIEKIAKRVQKVTDRNYNDSVRIARTETNRISNLGREDSFKVGEEIGLKLQKKWVSTSDPRTRESHLKMQGEAVSLNEKFSNGLEYPSAVGGKARDVCNCRCTIVAEFIGVKKSSKLQKLESDIKNQSFQEWEKRK